MRKKSQYDIRRQHRATDFREPQLELELIAGMSRSIQVLEEVNNNFNSEWISSDRNKRIYDMIIDLYTTDNELMDTKSFKNCLSVAKEKRKLYLSVWNKIVKMSRKVTPAATITASKKLEKLYTARNIQIGIKESLKLLELANSGDLTNIHKATGVIADLNEHVQAKANSKVAIGDPVSDYKKYKKDFRAIQKDPSAVIGIPTGVRELDRYMIGLRKGELGVVLGPTGGGKSITILEFLCNAWNLQDLNSVAVTIEMSKDQYMNRLYCHMAGIPYTKFRKYQLSPLDWNRIDYVVERMRKRQNKIKIIDMPEGCSVLNCKTEVKKLMQSMDIGLVVVDYMNIMCGPDGKIDFGWQNQLEIAVQMKLEFARALELPVWSACQTDGSDNFGFSKHIKDQLDVAGLLELTDSTQEDGIIKWNWLKTRDFEGLPVTLNTDRNYMRMTPLPDDMYKREKVMKKINKKKKKKRVTV